MNRSYSAADIRIRNNRVVFDLIRQKEEILRPDISSYTGMTPPTVMKVVQSFLSRGILKNAGEAETSLGRKPTKLVFNPDAANAIGVLFEGREMRAGLVNLAGEIIQSRKLPMDCTFSSGIQTVIIDMVQELTRCVSVPVLGIGLGVPGVVDAENQIIEFAPLVGIADAMDCSGICSEIKSKTNLNVCMDNDVNAAAVGEFMFRKLKENDDLLYIAVGTGVGAGIILNGQLRRGARNLAGELGYTVKNTDYQVSRSNPGWLESQIGQKSLMERFHWGGYESDGEVPSELISYLVENLAPPIANLATQLDIKTIIVGGMATDAFGKDFLAPLQGKINMLSLEPADVIPPLCADSGVTGAAMLAFEQNLNDWLSIRENG